MLVSQLLLCALASLTMAPAPASATTRSPPVAKSPISDRPITVSHRTIFSQRSFNATRTALESAIPKLNTTAIELLNQGNTAGARDALKALPALSSFIVPPRDFGELITIWGNQGENAVQYEIGNPYTASKFARFQLGASLYPPIRVSLFEEPKGVVQFAFERPTTTFGQFGDARLQDTAEALDNELTQLLLFAGGWPSDWPLLALP